MPPRPLDGSLDESWGARMVSKELFDRYISALRKTAIEDKTEHTDRAALQSLLQELADRTQRGVKVQHEPKRVAAKGAPDFKVGKGGLILGYVENKGIDENLTKVLKSEQIAKYKSLSSNIILTDYLDFVWINKYGPPQRERLCHATDLENLKFRLHEDRVDAVAKLLSGFFSSAPEGIGRAQQLALALATRSRLLRDYLGEELVRQEREHKEGRLYGLFQVFRDQIFHELTLKEFADALAQMLAYGLFLARFNSDSQPVTLHNAREYVPGSFRLIRELVDFLNELEKDEYRDVRWVVEEVLVHRQWAPTVGHSRGPVVPPAQGDQPQGPRRRRGGAQAVRARPVHLLLRRLSARLRQGDEQGSRRLLHAAADRELHRARGGRHPEGSVRDRPMASPTTSASRCWISPAVRARSYWKCFRKSLKTSAARLLGRLISSCASISCGTFLASNT